jgi:glucose-1-phosphate thymidylyltransferase
VIYADTLIETDFSFLASKPADAVTWVKAVPDPRRFGVANQGKDGWVTHLVEKPKDVENNLALVGCYYFQDPKLVLQAIDDQVERNLSLKNEFYLADAVNVMLEHGVKMRIQTVETWLDAGTIDDVLSTNRYYLEHGCDNTTQAITRKNVVILPPVYIHPDASVESSVIGPHAAIGIGCQVNHCIIRDSIIDDHSVVTDAVLEHSLIGQEVRIQGKADVLNVGDHSVLDL